MRPLRVTVCELSDDRAQFEDDWSRLVDHVRAERSELVVLPEMPFARWLAASAEFDRDAWESAVRDHEDWLVRLGELTPAAAVSSRPVTRGERRLNEGFAWSRREGYRVIHDKRYLPDETGYWEARWYGPGDGTFEVSEVGGVRLGMMICTDLWSLGHAERMGKAGAEIIATPRATGRAEVEKWLTGGRAAAIVSGAFSVSSNWSAGDGGADFGGVAWVIEPDGTALARTTRTEPFATVAIDLGIAEAAKSTYPRYALR